MHRIIGMALLLNLCACSQYDFSVNDNVVYTPKPILKESSVSDPALKACLQQTFKDKKHTNISQVTSLRCTHAGIASIAGLERYFALTELDLSDNAIADVTPLTRLGKLTLLHLENNQIRDAAPLLSLIKLSDLRIEGNNDAGCKDLYQVRTSVKDNAGSALLPDHCDQ